MFLIEVKSQEQGRTPLLDVQSALYDSEFRPAIIGGRYGLGSKDVTPDQISAVFDELQKIQVYAKNGSP